MYIQITNRCNMTCNHCCFACTSRGSDMTQEHFEKAIALSLEHAQPITIGGGEPTLHPKFKEFLLYAQWELADVSDSIGLPAVHLVTNGSNTAISLKIALLAKMGYISASVSKDQYHDPIDEQVYRAFEKPHKSSYDHLPDHDYRGINDGSNLIVAVGRAKKWGNNPYHKCGCNTIFITPKGNIYPCSCRKTKLAHLDDNDISLAPEYFEGYCEKDPNYKEKVLDPQNMS